MSKKIKIQISNQTFELPSNALWFDKWKNEPYINMNAKNTASLIKQFVKKNFPNIKVWATSDVYSGGSSVRVNVSNSDGSSVSEKFTKKSKDFQIPLKLDTSMV